MPEPSPTIIARIALDRALWDRCEAQADQRDLDPCAAAALAIEAGLTAMEAQPQGGGELKRPQACGPRGENIRPRDPIPFFGKSSPAAIRQRAPNKSCWGCGRKRPFDGAYYCPTCRQRAGKFGWCGCDSALYATGCYPRTRRQLDAHRKAARATKGAGKKRP